MAGSNKVVVKFLADTDQMRKSLKGIETSLSRFGKAALGIGTALAGAFVVKGLVDFGVQAVKTAGELEQLQGAAEQLFGPSGVKQMETWAKGAADSLGLSESAALQAGNQFAIFGQIQGKAGNDLVEWTQQQTELAADLAAMYGGTTTDAVNALTAAQKGNFEQMDRYGIPVTARMVEAHGKEKLGIDGVYASWDNATKSRVIEDYIRQSEGATAASGQFAREADTLQGVLQRLQANLENVGTEFGNALLPVVAAFADSLLPVVKELAPIIGELGTQLAEALAPALDAIGKVLPSIAEVFSVLAGTLAGVLSTALQSVVPIITSLSQKLAEFATRIAPVAQRLVEALARVFDALWKAIDPVLDVLLDLAATLIEAAIPFVELLAEVLVDVIDALVPLIRAISLTAKALTPLITAFTTLIVAVLTPLMPLLSVTIELLAVGLTKAIIFVANALGTQLIAWGKWAKSTTKLVGPTIEKLLGWAANLAEGFAFLPVVGDDFAGVASRIRGAGASITSSLNAMGDSAIGAGTQLQGLEAAVFDFESTANEVSYYDSLLSIPRETEQKARENGEKLGKTTGRGAAKGVKDTKNEFAESIKSALEVAEGLFEEWRSKVVGWMDLGSAYDEANDAKARLASLNEDLAALRLTPDYDKAEEAKLLEEIDKAASEAGKTWLDRFTEQITNATDFANQLGQLKNSGLNQVLIDQVAAMGPVAGSELATEIITGGSGLIDTLNGQSAVLDQAGVDLGLTMANAAAPAGKNWGMKFMFDDEEGLVATIQANSKKVKKRIKKALATEVEVKVRYVADYSNAGPAAGGGGGGSGIGGIGGVGFSAPLAGAATVSNLQSYERLNGSKWRDRVR